MAKTLPPLRTNLDVMPSPVDERPGLLVRDSYRYSDATLIVPPLLVECLRFFDGRHTDLDLREHLFRVTGELETGRHADHLCQTLSEAGFLEDEVYGRLKQEREAEFARAPSREPAHAGAAYPAEAEALRTTVAGYLDGALPEPRRRLAGIAAPHVSPAGGWQSYRAAYQVLEDDLADRVFVILGTSHFGEPERFGLTRKPYVTPYGAAQTEASLVDFLERAAPDAVALEDYCHAVEHSIEFQVVFLQHLFGRQIRILPVLCGAFARSVYEGGLPESQDRVARFFGALGELAAREGDRLFWVLGIDLAHMGVRYGDPFPVRENWGEMIEVEARDRDRLGRVLASDAAGFWERVQERHDDLKWCGSAPLYTFLRAVPGLRGRLLHYQQWNIDPQSVVSFAGLAFER